MLLVNALAGTGKTSVLKWGFGIKVPNDISLTDEQKRIVVQMRSYKYKSAVAMAFNRSIAKKLEREMPPGVVAGTSNALGHRIWNNHVGQNLKPDPNKSSKLLKEVAPHLAFEERLLIEPYVTSLVRLCKSYVTAPTHDNLVWLSERFDIELTDQIATYVQMVYDRGVNTLDFIDFDDQTFMPLYHNVQMPKYDIVAVDEVQDLTVAKQLMALGMLKEDGRMVAVGDVHQSIYAYNGADADALASLWNMMIELRTDAIELPMTITQRCPKQVVYEARRYVPEFKAADTAPEGIVGRTSEREIEELLLDISKGHMVLCRANAPLTSLAFKLIGQRRRCYIQGRNIGEQLKQELRRQNKKHNDFRKAVCAAVDRIEERIQEIRNKGEMDERKVESQRDRAVCIRIIAESCDTFGEYYKAIDDLFKDAGEPGDVQLSTVHKAKGLEHPSVIIWKPSKLPMLFNRRGMKGPAYQYKQECNLAYVGYTRSMHSLLFADEVRDKPEEDWI